MKIASWNVLHLIHECNYEYDTSFVLAKYNIKQDITNESKRLADIVNVIKKLLADGTIVCLQEVPGDLLTMLRYINSVVVYDYKYPRVPSLKTKPGLKIYEDPCEYLVVVVPNTSVTTQPHVIQFDDLGKACQIVKTNGFTILNVHMPLMAAARHKALESIVEYTNKLGSDFVLVGDMNMRVSDLRQELNSLNVKNYNIVVMNKDTHKKNKLNKPYYSKIDHAVIPATLKATDISVGEDNDMSDHFIITFDVSQSK